MNINDNPFSPGAGAPPPELVGRETILEDGKILFGRLLRSRSERSFLLTGLRGVGKTVLLNEIKHSAEQAACHTILLEAEENQSLAIMLVPLLRNLLFSLNRLENAGNKVRRAFAVLKGFMKAVKIKVGDIELGIDVDPELGTADSGYLEKDLTDLFAAIGEAAMERKTAIGLFIDEIQYFSVAEMGALIKAMHRMQQLQLPIGLVGAGLPNLPGLMGDAKSYSERLFHFPIVGPLLKSDVVRALQDPAKASGVKFTQEALDEIYRLTEGYPYFVQEWGYQCWNRAKKSPINLQAVKEATPFVIKRLDENFFRVRFDRLTPAEKNYLRAMAELDVSANRSGDVAAILGVKISSVGPVRAHLIKKGMIYSPAHGDMAFTVPLFGDFMRRVMPLG